MILKKVLFLSLFSFSSMLFADCSAEAEEAIQSYILDEEGVEVSLEDLEQMDSQSDEGYESYVYDVEVNGVEQSWYVDFQAYDGSCELQNIERIDF